MAWAWPRSDVARALGAKVIAAASTDEKLQLCIERGAHGVVNYSTEDLKSRVRELTDGGADIAVDPVGGELSEVALRSLGNGGRLLVIGFASGRIPELPANQILLRNRSVLGVDWGAWAMSDPEGNAVVMSEVLTRVDDATLSPAEPGTYWLADAGTALRDLLERRITGKVCLTLRPLSAGGQTAMLSAKVPNWSIGSSPDARWTTLPSAPTNTM